jgi:hypothetical protein
MIVATSAEAELKPSQADPASGNVVEEGPNRLQVQLSAGRDPVTRRYRQAHRMLEGSNRVARRAADELVTKVQRGMHMAARATVAELLERRMLDLEPQDRDTSTMVRCNSAIDVRKVGVSTARRSSP